MNWPAWTTTAGESRRVVSLVLGLLVVAAWSRAADAPYLVKDIWAGPESSGPRELVDIGGTLFFTADDGIHREPTRWPGASARLWRSDGTETGTYMLAEIHAHNLRRAGRRLFFTSEAAELWTSDGTPAGTARVKAFADQAWRAGPEDLLAVGDLLLFVADDGTGYTLWRSDGTPEGTWSLAVGEPKRAGSAMRCSAVVGRRLFFALSSGDAVDLWRTDGTREGTLPFARVSALSTRGDSFTGIGNLLYFGVADPVLGVEPWVSDGTAEGTRPLRDVRPGPDSSWPVHFTGVGEKVFFAASSTSPEEIWMTDGTEAGTIKVAETKPAFVPLYPGFFLGPFSLVGAGRRLFYAMLDDPFGTHGFGKEPYTSDGTAAGTGLLKDICPGPCSGGFGSPVAIDGVLYFAADDGARGGEIWTSDGSPEGTRPVVDSLPPWEIPGPGQFTVSGPRLFFSATRRDTGWELWALPLKRQ